MEHPELSIDQIKKNNELFSNSLAYMILGRKKFEKILYKQGKDDKFINDFCGVIQKYIDDFAKELEKLN